MTEDIPNDVWSTIVDSLQYSIANRHTTTDRDDELQDALEWLQQSYGPLEMDPRLDYHEDYNEIVRGLPENCPYCGSKLVIVNGEYTLGAQFITSGEGYHHPDDVWRVTIDYLSCNECNETLVLDGEPRLPKKYSQIPMADSRNDYAHEWERWDDCTECGRNLCFNVTLENDYVHVNDVNIANAVDTGQNTTVEYIDCDSCGAILEDNTRVVLE